MNMKTEIQRALAPLIGLPVWGAFRAAEIMMLDFGDRVTRPNRIKGGTVVCGTYALHLSCPWRVVGPEGIVVAYEDRLFPEDEESDWSKFDGATEPSLCESRMSAWLERNAENPVVVQKLEADAVGGFRLLMSQGFVLEAFPSHSLRGDCSEHWRLLNIAEETRHFVVSNSGIEGQHPTTGCSPISNRADAV